MKRKSITRTKLLCLMCAVAALFFGAMLLWYMSFPEADYQKSIDDVKAKQFQEEEQIAKLTVEVEKQLEELLAEQETVTEELTELQAEKTKLDEDYAALSEKKDNLEKLPELVLELRKSYGEQIRQLEEKIVAGETDVKICYLTFEDGPHNLTKDILAKLDEHDAYATFFTIGSDENFDEKEYLRNEMMGGHTVANHSKSHAVGWGLYTDIEELTKQIKMQDEIVFEATGFHTDIFRFPNGSAQCPFMEEAELWLEEQGYKWVDWNASAQDNAYWGVSDQIALNIRTAIKEQAIVVVQCHDFNSALCDALDVIIPELKEQGYIFLPLLPQSIMMGEAAPVE